MSMEMSNPTLNDGWGLGFRLRRGDSGGGATGMRAATPGQGRDAGMHHDSRRTLLKWRVTVVEGFSRLTARGEYQSEAPARSYFGEDDPRWWSRSDWWWKEPVAVRRVG